MVYRCHPPLCLNRKRPLDNQTLAGKLFALCGKISAPKSEVILGKVMYLEIKKFGDMPEDLGSAVTGILGAVMGFGPQTELFPNFMGHISFSCLHNLCSYKPQRP